MTLQSRDDSVRSLLEALAASPNNVPLRKLVASTLLDTGREQETETHYKEFLKAAPRDTQAKYGLARAFYQQDKDPQALVFVENLMKAEERPGKVLDLHAQLLLRAGQVEDAAKEYRRSIMACPVYLLASAPGALFVGEMDEEAFPSLSEPSWPLLFGRRMLRSLLGLRHGQ